MGRLTYPLNGRLKNTFTAAKTSSIIQCTAELFVIENNLYCDAIEMQFVNLKSEPSNSVPWLITNKDNKRNSVESRIVAVHRSMQKQPPTPAKVKRGRYRSRSKLMILLARLLNEKEGKRRVVLTKTVVKR